MTPKISTSLQLGIIPIGEQRSRLPLFLIVNPLHLHGLQDIQFVFGNLYGLSWSFFNLLARSSCFTESKALLKSLAKRRTALQSGNEKNMF